MEQLKIAWFETKLSTGNLDSQLKSQSNDKTLMEKRAGYIKLLRLKVYFNVHTTYEMLRDLNVAYFNTYFKILWSLKVGFEKLVVLDKICNLPVRIN